MTKWFAKGDAQATKLVNATPKDSRELLAAALDQGFKIRRSGSDHITLLPPVPNVPIVRLSTSPSDRRTVRNVKRDLIASGFVTDMSAAEAAAKEAKKMKLEAKRRSADDEAEESAARAQVEADAMTEARTMAQRLAAEAQRSFKEHEYHAVWEKLRPGRRALAALDRAGGSLPGYAELFEAVYGESMGDNYSRVQMLATSLAERGLVFRKMDSSSKVVSISLTEKGSAELNAAMMSALAREKLIEVSPDSEPMPAPGEILAAIESLADRLLDALGFDAVRAQRDELRVRVEKYEAQGPSLPGVGELNEEEVIACRVLVQTLRKPR